MAPPIGNRLEPGHHHGEGAKSATYSEGASSRPKCRYDSVEKFGSGPLQSGYSFKQNNTCIAISKGLTKKRTSISNQNRTINYFRKCQNEIRFRF